MLRTLSPQYDVIVSQIYKWSDDDTIPTKYEEYENLKSRDQRTKNVNEDDALSTTGKTVNKNKSNTEELSMLRILVQFGKTNHRITLNNVGYVPSGKRTLISGSRAMEVGCSWNKGLFKLCAAQDVSKPSLSYLEVTKSGIFNKQKVNVTENKFSGDLELWHRRLIYTNVDNLIKMSKQDVTRGLPNLTKRDLDCTTCIRGKQTKKLRKSIPNITTKGVLELVHTDVWGPTKYESRG
uniref:GAG-pre-integrase domain-containing protein n=1 Tax=Strigamia maritima TaxID=126957 RepID=T1IJH5_STRMM